MACRCGVALVGNCGGLSIGLHFGLAWGGGGLLKGPKLRLCKKRLMSRILCSRRTSHSTRGPATVVGGVALADPVVVVGVVAAMVVVVGVVFGGVVVVVAGACLHTLPEKVECAPCGKHPQPVPPSVSMHHNCVAHPSNGHWSPCAMPSSEGVCGFNLFPAP